MIANINGDPAHDRASSWLIAVASVAAFLLLLALLVSCGSGTAVQNPASQQQGPDILQAERLSAAAGWVLTGDALMITNDSGGTWAKITPSGVTPFSIKGVFFLDPKHGWLVAPSAGVGSLLVYRTADGGSSWESTELGASDTDSFGAPAYLSFPDTQNGWLVIKLVTSSNFSKGNLYRTTDGGVSWTRLSIPIGDPIVFHSASDGFVAGGPAGDQLYMTKDGGASWQAQTIPRPPRFSGSYPVYGLPAFLEDSTALLPVTYTGPAPGMALYSSEDGGNTWELQQSLAFQQPLNVGVRVPSDVTDSGVWIAAHPAGARILKAAGLGAAGITQEVEEIAPNGLPSGVVDIDFADGDSGWAVVHQGECPPGLKDGCTVIQQLFATTDGGQTWSVLVPQ